MSTLDDVKSKIVAVTVYESRAQVHRAATVLLPKGASTLVFKDIPRNINRDSVQVGLRLASCTSSVTLNGITFDHPDPVPPADNAKPDAGKEAEIAKLEDELKKLKESAEELALELQLIGDEVKITEDFFAMAVAGRGKEDPRVFEDVGKWAEVIAAKTAKDKETLNRRRAIKKQQDDNAEQLAALNDKLRSLRGSITAPPRDTRPVMKVHLESVAAVADAEVLVSYMVPDASWTAVYDLRVDVKRKQAALTYHALVRQNTSEAWPNVNLTMSTAKPAVSGRAPDLSPWYARVQEMTPYKQHAQKKKASRSGGFGGAAQQAFVEQAYHFDEEDDDGDATSSTAEPASFEQVEAPSEPSGAAMSFDVPHQHTVPCNNDPVRVSLSIIALTPEITYTTRPSAAEVVYAVLNAANPSNFALMPGEANVFVDGQFVTKTRLPRISPKNNMHVGIGQDAGVAARYKFIKDERSEHGGMLSGKKIRKEYVRQVVLKNHKEEPISIKVEHEYPTADDSKIEISLAEPASLARETDLKDGKIVLSIELKAKEEKKIPIRIQVQYPVDMNLNGL